MTGYRKSAPGPTLYPDRAISLAAHVAGLAPAAFILIAASLAFAMASSAVGQSPSRPVLHVAASSDLTPIMPVLAQTYERATGVRLIVTLGPSESQVAKIEAGEPADLFLGTDFVSPEKLVADGLTNAKAPIAYANGALVLFARKDSPLQPLSLDSLEDPRLQSLAISNQLHSPFGRASAAALNRLKLIGKLETKLVVSEDAMHAADDVASGKAQLGLISLTIAKSQSFQQIGSYLLIPVSQYPPVKQYAVVLSKGNVSAAHRFVEWITSSDIQSKLSNIGLDAVR